jgi:hypothetical protein
VLNESQSSILDNGSYHYHSEGERTKAKVYLSADSVLIDYQLPIDSTKLAPDLTLPNQATNLPGAQEKHLLTQYRLETGIITVPVKFRPKVADFVPQLNPTLNANLFVGLRHEWYKFRYNRSPYGYPYRREDKQLALSIGAFTGLGQNPINPSNTQPAITYEYDGLVWQNGLAVGIDYNHLTFGLALGFDRLQGRDRGTWIYQGKPWIGATFGFNFN